MVTLVLTPDQEHFAAQLVAEGRFRDIGHVVATAIADLQSAEAERLVFVASLDEAIKESERDGHHHIDDVTRDMHGLIQEIASGRA